MEKKYKLTEETINCCSKILYRIEALKDFGDVKKGDKGGYVQSEENLSQEGDCWIYDNAQVFNDAKVYDNAKICKNSQVYDNAYVYGDAIVINSAQVSDEAQVYGSAYVCDNARVYGNAQVSDNATVYCDAQVYENALVYGNAKVSGNAVVCENAQVFGNARVYGYTKICGSAEIKNNTDYIVFKNWWSSGRYFTWTKSNNMWAVGCFFGTGEELIKKAYKDSELSGREYERLVKYVETILQDSK